MWWEKELPVNCTVKHMETVLGHSLQAVQYPIFSETEVSELGLVSHLVGGGVLLVEYVFVHSPYGSLLWTKMGSQ